ncbi:MAG: MEDS domain-containing protein [Kineosporiaceae bacterium]
MTVSPTAPEFVPGDHVCGFYYGEDERDAMLLPFLREGLVGGDKCLVVVDSAAPEDVVAGIGGTAESVASGQLEFYDADQTYLSTGAFDADRMIAFWEDRARGIAEEGRFGFSRLVGEMSWLERVPPPRGSVVRYESWADGFAARYAQTVLCLYDLRRLGSGILMDLMRTHPKLLLGGLVLENPHHISADEFDAARD